MEQLFLIVSLFFLTALVYSIAGFGGGSTYIAILILFAFPYSAVPKVALICNLIVVTGGFTLFLREGHFSARKVIPFIVTSIPAAYWGGTLPIGKRLFSLLLGISLLVAAIRMFLSEEAFVVKREVSWKKSWAVGLPVGALLGALSGLVGIGGGIFLSPVLYLLGWANAKEAAAAASFFILVNSVAGLFGQFSKEGLMPDAAFLVPLGIAVLLGGQIGSRLGSQRLPKLFLQRVTALLILFVSGKLLWGLV
ncbi:MAG: sulfite exporter TauE/SafE family protein [Deltaproteobacteria bacterium]|nr:sulfite exporter TauE/SafE family protein [Deltaproteobacteria bacterium]